MNANGSAVKLMSVMVMGLCCLSVKAWGEDGKPADFLAAGQTMSEEMLCASNPKCLKATFKANPSYDPWERLTRPYSNGETPLSRLVKERPQDWQHLLFILYGVSESVAYDSKVKNFIWNELVRLAVNPAPVLPVLESPQGKQQLSEVIDRVEEWANVRLGRPKFGNVKTTGVSEFDMEDLIGDMEK